MTPTPTHPTPQPTYAFTIPSIHDDTPLDCWIYHPPLPPSSPSKPNNKKTKSKSNNSSSTSSSTTSHNHNKLDNNKNLPSRTTTTTQSRQTSPAIAILSHPYAPLGGSSSDPIILSLTSSLLSLQNHIVITFNFRGAGPSSAGKTSWTGRAEVEDLASVVGLGWVYLKEVLRGDGDDDDDDMLSTTVFSSIDGEEEEEERNEAEGSAIEEAAQVDDDDNDNDAAPTLLLAGYSFGALILCRLPGLSSIIQRFSTAEPGTAASEIFLRARTLARKTRLQQQQQQQQQQQAMEKEEKEADGATSSPPTRNHDRGRLLPPHPSPSSPSKPASHLLLTGGEETSAATRRPSRESRRSVEVMREMPHAIKHHMRRHSGQFSRPRRSLDQQSTSTSTPTPRRQADPAVRFRIRYLLISPVLFPLSTTLLSPGLPFTMGRFPSSSSSSSSSDQDDGLLSRQHPTLIVFGSSDTFTSSKKLRQWAEKLKKDAPPDKVCWAQIDGAGHFWRENDVMQALQSRILEWAR